MTTTTPQALFKYVGFGDRVLEQLYKGEIYFSDPSTFNDPLDCRPIVEPDEPPEQLKKLLAELVVRRTQKEVDAATKQLRLRGSKALERRQALSQSAAMAILGEIEYQATNPEIDDAHFHLQAAFADAIQTEIRNACTQGADAAFGACELPEGLLQGWRYARGNWPTLPMLSLLKTRSETNALCRLAQHPQHWLVSLGRFRDVGRPAV